MAESNFGRDLTSLLLERQDLHHKIATNRPRAFEDQTVYFDARRAREVHPSKAEFPASIEVGGLDQVDPWKLALVADRTDNLIVITDVLGRTEWVNPGFTRLTQYTLSEVVGRKPGSLLQGPETDPGVIDLMRNNLSRGQGFRVELLNYSKSGRSYWLLIDCNPVRDASGVLTHFVAIETDLTERKALETRLIEQLRIAQRLNFELEQRRQELVRLNTLLVESADTDSLTGLKNRGYFQGRLDEVQRNPLGHPSEISVILLDIDDFDQYNIAHGHLAGDLVLLTIARIMGLEACRGDVAARLGGEEFGLLSACDVVQAMTRAERIRLAIQREDWPLRPITVSLGVATFGPADENVDVVERADRALKQSKWAGRNRSTHHREIDPSQPSRQFRT